MWHDQSGHAQLLAIPFVLSPFFAMFHILSAYITTYPLMVSILCAFNLKSGPRSELKIHSSLRIERRGPHVHPTL